MAATLAPPAPTRSRLRLAVGAFGMAIIMLAAPACTLTQGDDYSVTTGLAVYFTVYAHESWEISYDLYVFRCKGSGGCVRDYLNAMPQSGWGIAQFHDANNKTANLVGVMQRVLAADGWMPGFGLPDITFDTLGVNGGIGAGYCMQGITDAIGSDAWWNAAVGPWYSRADCNLGRVLNPNQ